MRIGKWGRLLLFASPLLGVLPAGCGKFFPKPVPTPTTPTPTSNGSSGGIYVLNQGKNQIAAYTIVAGNLTAAAGSPYTLAAAPTAIAIAPNGNFLYVATAQGIYLYTIGSGGGLTLANNSNVISSDFADTMQVDATNSWLVEAGPNLAELIAIPINSVTGATTSTIEQNIQLPAVTVQQIALSPDNTHAFVALGPSGTEEVIFAAGNSDPFGNVANIPVLNSAGASVAVAVDPSNRLFYVGETAATKGTNTGGLRVFNYNTLAEITPGSPYATGGLAPFSILPEATGTYVYVANRSVSGITNGNISGFTVATSGTTYSLTALSSAASTGITPVSLAEDSTGSYILVVDSGGSPDLEAYTMKAGILTSAITASTGTDPVVASAVAAAP